MRSWRQPPPTHRRPPARRPDACRSSCPRLRRHDCRQHRRPPDCRRSCLRRPSCRLPAGAGDPARCPGDCRRPGHPPTRSINRPVSADSDRLTSSNHRLPPARKRRPGWTARIAPTTNRSHPRRNRPTTPRQRSRPHSREHRRPGGYPRTTWHRDRRRYSSRRESPCKQSADQRFNDRPGPRLLRPNCLAWRSRRQPPHRSSSNRYRWSPATGRWCQRQSVPAGRACRRARGNNRRSSRNG